MNATLAKEKKLHLTGTGAIYKRYSRDGQDDERQDISIERFLSRNAVSVTKANTYIDEARKRREGDERPDFARLLKLADEGKVKWIVVDRQDRMEAYDKFETVATISRLRKAGCRAYDANDREITAGDIASFITTTMASHKSEEEVRDTAHRVLTDKVVRAKRGEWPGGQVPYGLDVVAFRLIGGEYVEQWRCQILGCNGRIETTRQNGDVKRAFNTLRVKIAADGTRSDYNGPNNFPAADRDEVLQLRPTLDTAQLDVVKSIFRRMDSEATTPSAIARQLEIEGVTPPAYSDRWRANHIEEMLTNPVYIGRPAYNRHTSGAYRKWENGEEVAKERGEKSRRHARHNWILSKEELYAPVIDVTQWERVQNKMDARKVKPRGGKNPGYLFSGLVFCANCGGKMVGSKYPVRGASQDEKPHSYLCGTYNKHTGKRDACKCKAYRVMQSQLVEAMRRYFADTGPIVEEMTYAVQRKKPESFKKAMVSAIVAWNQMRQHVFAAYGREVLDTVNPERQEEILEAIYRRWFNHHNPKAQARLDQLQADYRDQTLSLARIRSEMQREVIEQHLSEIEREIKELRSHTVNAADAYHSAMAEANQIGTAWRSATDAIDTDAFDRRRAAAIAAVIRRINVTFRPTGKTWPAGHVERIEIVPTDAPFTESASTTRS